jgi:predicted RNA-binding protein with RPS1 domain
MTLTMRRSKLALLTTTLCLSAVSAWQSNLFSQGPTRRVQSPRRIDHSHLTLTDVEEEETVIPCYYKIGEKWKQRITIDELKVGQKLVGERIGNADLLAAKTGPKVFFECGVGRIDAKGKWQMVSGMLRVAKNFSKPKVVKKKIKKLSGQTVELYVQKIRLSEGKLEVCTSLEALETQMEKEKERRGGKTIIPASSLQAGQEVVGKVVEVRPYGVMVDVGANRKGLLHIQKVADLYKKYIDKETGLVEAGLERGAEVRLSVSSNEKKRLYLDFTRDTLDLAAEQAAREAKEKEEKLAARIAAKEEKAAAKIAKELAAKELEAKKEEESSQAEDDESVDPYADEAGAWAAYYDEEDYEEEEDDDRDIEDALGIGNY